MKITKKLLITSVVVVMSLSSPISKTYASTVGENQNPLIQESIIDSALDALTDLEEQGTIDILKDNNQSEETIDTLDNTNEVKENKDDEIARENEETVSNNLLSTENTDVDGVTETATNTDSKKVDNITDKIEDKKEITAEEKNKTEKENKAEVEKEEADKKSDDKSAKDSKETKAKKESKKETKKEAKKPSYSESDLRLLASLVYAEAGNQSYKGMLAVANIVLNRVKSDVYSHVNTIEEVIYDNKWAVQFAVTKKNKSGVSMLDKALKSYDTGKFSGSNPKAEKEAMQQAIKAAKAALEGENNIGSYLCFNAINSSTNKIKKKYSYKIIGDHIFYRKGA